MATSPQISLFGPIFRFSGSITLCSAILHAQGRTHEHLSNDRPTPVLTVSDHWLTYAAAAGRLGVSAEAVRQLALRHKWPRRRPNANPYGRVEIAIPADFEARPRPTVQHPSERLSDTPSNGEVDAWRDRAERAEMVADLERERADQAEKRADAADADRRVTMAMIDSFAVRADRAEAATAAERARADALRDRLQVVEVAADQADELRRQAEAAQIAQAEAEADAAELRQAEVARKGGGRLARLRAAWRGA